MKTKHLFYSLALSATFAACSQEEIVSQQDVVKNDLGERPVVGNVILDLGGAESRGTTGDRAFNDIAFVEGEDGFGARIIDVYSPFSVPNGYTLDHAWRNYDIKIEFASSNYKYINDGGSKWVTDALMVEGNYMFYYPYNEANLARTPNKVVLPMTQIVKPNEEEGYRNPIKDLYEGENPAIVGYAFLSATDQDVTVRPELNHIFAYPQFTLVNEQTKRVNRETVGVDLTIEKILVKSTNFVKNYEINHKGIDKSLRDFALAQQKKTDGSKWADAVAAGTWTKEASLLKNAKTTDIADAKTSAQANVDGTIEVLFEDGLSLAYGEEYTFNLVMPAAIYNDANNLSFTIYLSDDKMIDGAQHVDPNNYTVLTYAPSKRYPTEEYNFPTNGEPYTKSSKGTLGRITLKNETIVDAVAPAQIIDDVEEFEAYLASIVDNSGDLEEIEEITTNMKPNQFVLARNTEGVADMKIDATVVELVKKYMSEGSVEFLSTMEVVGDEETVEMSQMIFKNVCFKAGNVTVNELTAEKTEICGEAIVTVPADANANMGAVTIKDGELIVKKDGFLGKDAHNVTVTSTKNDAGEVIATGKLTIDADNNNFNGLTMNAGEVVVNEEIVAHIGNSANANVTAGKITVEGTLEVWSGYEVAADIEIELNGKIDLSKHEGAAVINSGKITNNSSLVAENKLGGEIVMGNVSAYLKVSGNGGVVNNTYLAEVDVIGDNQTVYAEMSSVEDLESNNFDSSSSINKIIVTGLWTIDGEVELSDAVKTIEFNGGNLYVNGSSTFDISKQNVIIAADTEWNGRSTGTVKTNVAKENFKYEYLSAKARNAKLTIGNVAVETVGTSVNSQWGVALSSTALNSIEYNKNDNTTINSITVSSAQDLLSVFELIKAGKMKPNGTNDIHAKIKLANDIDFNGLNWYPLGMNFDLDGQNFTLSNVNIEGDKAGLFGYAGNSIISNLTLKNVTVTGYQAGAFIGSAENAKIINCKLEGAVTVNFKKYGENYANGVGAVVGVIAYSNNVFDINVTDADIVINRTGITYANGKTAETNELVGVVYGGSYTI